MPVLIIAESLLHKQMGEERRDSLGEPGVTPALHGDETAEELLGYGRCHQSPRDVRLVYDAG